MDGYVWLWMVMYGYITYGYVWLSMAMYGYLWLCMLMYGYVWLRLHTVIFHLLNEKERYIIVVSLLLWITCIYRLNQLTWHNGLIPADEIWLKLGGDKGGSSVKISFQVVNIVTAPNFGLKFHFQSWCAYQVPVIERCWSYGQFNWNILFVFRWASFWCIVLVLSLLFKWAMLAGYSSRLLLNFGLAFFIPDYRLRGILRIISKFPEFLSSAATFTALYWGIWRY